MNVLSFFIHNIILHTVEETREINGNQIKSPMNKIVYWFLSIYFLNFNCKRALWVLLSQAQNTGKRALCWQTICQTLKLNNSRLCTALHNFTVPCYILIVLRTKIFAFIPLWQRLLARHVDTMTFKIEVKFLQPSCAHFCSGTSEIVLRTASDTTVKQMTKDRNINLTVRKLCQQLSKIYYVMSES